MKILEGLPLPDPDSIPDWKFNGPGILKFPGYIANWLLHSSNQTVLRMACAHQGCNKKLLFRLWHSTDTLILKKLAQRPDLPRFFYEILWLHGGDPVKSVLKSNSQAVTRGVSFENISIGPIIKLVEKKSSTGSEQKVVISGSKKDRILLAKTSHEEPILIALATDKISDVRHELLYRKQLPWSVISVLAIDPDIKIRSGVARYFSDFPLEITLPIEEKLFAEGGEIAIEIARKTRSEQIQNIAVKEHPEKLIYNNFLHPTTLEHYTSITVTLSSLSALHVASITTLNF
ncbi:MAG: hypothetical protein IPK77_00015 [Cellvibrio sp.]|nr:hypothetical protein [Cellvibrio sp.]